MAFLSRVPRAAPHLRRQVQYLTSRHLSFFRNGQREGSFFLTRPRPCSLMSSTMVNQQYRVQMLKVENEGDVKCFSVSATDPKSSSLQDSHPSRQRLGPSVRKLLVESGLDIASIKGTGPGGAVVKGDVLAAMKSKSKPEAKATDTHKGQKSTGSLAPAPPKSQAVPPSSAVSYVDLPTSQIRKVIAKRLLESKNGIPHLYLSVDTTLDATLALRKELKEKYGVHVSVNDFVIKAVASALKSVPEANGHWDEKTREIVPGTSIDISVAVATDKGLMTPILRNADQKSLPDISSEVKQLAGRARDGKLLPHEFQGGTFSISNLGMFPVDRFCAFINPPQACILAVGRGEPVVLWEEDASGHGKPRAATKLTLTLSADNRVIDTEIGGRFLDMLAGILKNPRRALL